MDIRVLTDTFDDGNTGPSRMPDTPGGGKDRERTGREEQRPAELPEPPKPLRAIRVTHVAGPADPVLADLMEKAFESADRDPNRFHSNPEKQREASEAFRRLIEEWQAENGTFTEEERRRARAVLGGP